MAVCDKCGKTYKPVGTRGCPYCRGAKAPERGTAEEEYDPGTAARQRMKTRQRAADQRSGEVAASEVLEESASPPKKTAARAHRSAPVHHASGEPALLDD